MATSAPTGVMLVPARSAVGDTTPPTPWWRLTLKRLGIQLLVIAPLVLNALINLYQTGQVQVPSKWAGLVTLLIVLYQTTMKGLKEQGNAQAVTDLQAQGVPVGQVIHPTIARAALAPLVTPPPPPNP